MPPKAANAAKAPAASAQSSKIEGGDENIVAPELPTGLATAGSGEGNLSKIGATAMARFMAEKGIKVVHVGGSLPLMDFDAKKDKGKSILIRFLSSDKPTDVSEFALFSFDVLDPERFPKDPADSKGVDGCVVQKAQLVASYAFKDWVGNVEKDAAGKPFHKADPLKGGAYRGDIVILTYGGDTQTARGQAPLKLFEISGVYKAPRPQAAPAPQPVAADAK